MSNDATEIDPRFLRNYSMLLASVWSSDEELTKLLADPTRYATEKGLPVAEGATVEVLRTPGETMPSKAEVSESWSGTPGRHVLRIPETPPIDLGELTEAELDSVAAGDNNIYFFML
jgi:hypothetical protein